MNYLFAGDTQEVGWLCGLALSGHSNIKTSQGTLILILRLAKAQLSLYQDYSRNNYFNTKTGSGTMSNSIHTILYHTVKECLGEATRITYKISYLLQSLCYNEL